MTYYANVKKRIALPLNENYNQYHSNLIETLNKMRDYQERGVIPQIRKGQKCSGCSLKDICMPKMNKETSVFQEIKKLEGLRS
ncbi:MAG: Dna2/Cas4 domain-containing protein [Eubacteriaceae bacterium]|nr:Dna2/Cas4 domain-containing protein [Eubacteriaceae bacterium]